MRIISSTNLRLGLTGLALFVVFGANDQGFRSIFDGTSGKGWILCDGKPLPKAFVQPEGLNPHGTGSYLVVHDTKAADFVLDFDYKLTRGCNSGVFIRVSDLNDPVNTGIEVAIDDTTGSGMHDPGALYDLVAARTNTQKPLGEWNHMTITVSGPKISVVLNGTEVSTINLDEWNTPGKRRTDRNTSFRTSRSASCLATGILDSRTTAAIAGSRTSSSRSLHPPTLRPDPQPTTRPGPHQEPRPRGFPHRF